MYRDIYQEMSYQLLKGIDDKDIRIMHDIFKKTNGEVLDEAIEYTCVVRGLD